MSCCVDLQHGNRAATDEKKAEAKKESREREWELCWGNLYTNSSYIPNICRST